MKYNYNQTKQIHYKNLNVEVKYVHVTDHIIAYRHIIEQYKRTMPKGIIQEFPEVPHKIFDKMLNYMHLS